MAGISFQCDFTSLNGWEYRLQIWDRNQTGNPANDFNIGPQGCEIKYDSKGGDNMMNEIMCSSMKFEFLIETTGQENYVNANLRSNTFQEKDIYFILWMKKGLGYNLLWGGFMITDLDTTEDVTKPYSIKLEAVDGLALLKDIPFVKNAHSMGAGPFTRAETYAGYSGSWNNGWAASVDNGKYKKVIHFLTEAIQYADLAGMSNNYTSLTEPTISSSANWWNGKHQSSYIDTQDPLWLTRINAEQFYKLRESNEPNATDYYDAMSCYDAIVNICRCWGVRCFYWAGNVYIIQVGLYNTAETGSSHTSPINIKTKKYSILGVPQSGMYNFVGDNSVSRYHEELYSSGEGRIKKLTGTKWNEYPPIKKVTTSFPSISNDNMFTFFPLIYGTTDSPHTWPRNSDGIQEIYHDIGTITDFASMTGLYIDLNMNFTNTSNSNSFMRLFYALQAKQSSASNWNSSLVAEYKPQTQELVWESVNSNSPQYSVSGVATINFTNSTLLGSNSQSFTRKLAFGSNAYGAGGRYHIVVVPPGQSVINIVNGTFVNNVFSNIIPPDASMTGDWDFRFITLVKATNTNTSNAVASGTVYGHGTFYQTQWTQWHELPWDGLYSVGQGRIGYPSSQYSNGDTFYQSQNSAQNPSVIAKVSNGAIGSVGQSTEVYVSSSDTYVKEIKDTLWGDCEVDDSPGSIQVYTGTQWEYTNFIGEWGRGIITGNNSITELLCEETLFLQNKPTYLGNYKLVTSTTGRFYSSNPNFPRMISPVTRFKDTFFDDRIFIPINLKINIGLNEVSGKYFEMDYSTSSVTSTSSNLPSTGQTSPAGYSSD